ncbi:transcription elongation factor GreA [Sodalis-like secondary symbiont of Drepanosiphum platanoidis]|uniref:transcription elongation factor GreA n=1 Tax=Sodalis-like secondary symbiont of Drepanosiphum platanoidis TaxID=2994493 RepID=UPI003464DC72
MINLKNKINNKIPMTLNGANKLQKELDYLINIRRSEIIKDISKAREYGDLKENSEYHSAREQQSFCEGKIQEIKNKLNNALIIDTNKIIKNGKVVFGSTVSIKNCFNNKVYSYKIVGNDEADLKKKLISINTPISRGLIGKKIGNIVNINTPGGKVKYKIINIKYI